MLNLMLASAKNTPEQAVTAKQEPKQKKDK